jgi:hypothetical protein
VQREGTEGQDRDRPCPGARAREGRHQLNSRALVARLAVAATLRTRYTAAGGGVAVRGSLSG